MAGEGKILTQEPLLERASLLMLLLALFGIPAAGFGVLVFALQIPRFLYGQAVPLLFAAEVASLLTVIVLVFLLRACLALPSAPSGFSRNVLDFLAMSGWHPAVIAALIGLLVLPPAWYLRSDNFWLLNTLRERGWAALTSVDVQSQLDGIAVVYQLALTGGVPLLFVLHMLSRAKPRRRILPWVLVPLLFVGTAVAVVVLVALLHHS